MLCYVHARHTKPELLRLPLPPNMSSAAVDLFRPARHAWHGFAKLLAPLTESSTAGCT